MNKDRASICKIISEMLDNPDKWGIYPTTEAFNALEEYIDGVRTEAIGWAYADACRAIDAGEDYRKVEVPSILARAKADLEGEK